MLIRYLNNFSEDELAAFLKKSDLSFIKKVLSERFSEDGITKSNLVRIVATMFYTDIVFDRKLRHRFVNALKPKHLTEIFNEIDEEEYNIKPYHYDRINEWLDLEEKNKLLLAERLGIEEFEKVSPIATSLKSIRRIEPEYALYDYQKKISDKVCRMIDADPVRRALIHLPTGAGKTRTAMNITCTHLNQRNNNLVLWLADREELCQQAFDEFTKAWRSLGSRPVSVYGFFAEGDQSLSGISSGLVVASLQKFHSLSSSQDKQTKLLYELLQKSVSLVIFDEAHKSIAETYQTVTDNFLSKEGAYLIGLTATPGRSFSIDGMTEEDKKLAEFYFNNKVNMDTPGYDSPIRYLVENRFLAEAQFISLNYMYSSQVGYELKNSTIKETNKFLGENRERNKIILETVRSECDEGKQVIVFACTVEHSQNLAVALNYLGIKAASIDSKSDSNASRREKIARYKNGSLQVLTNFSVLTAGFDAPNTSVAVIAKPTKSLVEYLQMAGRAMRGPKSGGNDKCNIYTVIDDIPAFKNVAIASQHWDELWKRTE